ncbi:SDR family oxidoreductase [Agrobacterium sp. RAC06]|uniref:SDR family oxidoreductase n=1 Tax=Agrobacterium sp. RAC06 TaxID=1842536 RepID=UPI00083D919A|nr:SDR family oxidoreductase [Agrobacterium sp. RAC06]AOG08605.1 3-beta hydroxysteroid dehydrogenase/isomerase family protein [Agrobacterium sp. RAC06]
MRIFVTGATGFIGSAVIPELKAAGHQILGLTRSAEGAGKLRAQGVEVHQGMLEEPQTLTRGAEKADAVIHLAFDHDFSDYAANCRKDAAAIAALGASLAGSDRPLLITSAVGIGTPAPGEMAREDVLNLDQRNPRTASERAGQDLLEQGVNVSAIRLSQIHDTRRQGLVSYLIDIARAKGEAVYVADGEARWSACHIGDAARLYRLATEKATPGARYNAVDEEGIRIRYITETIGESLNLPVRSIAPGEAGEELGAMAHFAVLDMAASSASTRVELGWAPSGPSLLADLAAMHQN